MQGVLGVLGWVIHSLEERVTRLKQYLLTLGCFSFFV